MKNKDLKKYNKFGFYFVYVIIILIFSFLIVFVNYYFFNKSYLISNTFYGLVFLIMFYILFKPYIKKILINLIKIVIFLILIVLSKFDIYISAGLLIVYFILLKKISILLNKFIKKDDLTDILKN